MPTAVAPPSYANDYRIIYTYKPSLLPRYEYKILLHFLLQCYYKGFGLGQQIQEKLSLQLQIYELNKIRLMRVI